MSLLSPADIAGMHATVIQLANATLTAIESPGPLEGNGDPGAPVEQWTGAAPAFLERVDKARADRDAEGETLTDTLIVFDRAGADVAAIVAGADWEASSVVVSDNRMSPSTVLRFSVVGLEHEADGTMDHALLTLNAGTVIA